jgi:membrane protease YdiL (CAAX protease family)
MEDLLKAKAKLWYFVSSGIVLLALALTALRFPSDAWKLALIGIGWLAFGGSMAEKAVTLVSAPSSSGEPEKIPTSRRMAAALGMLTFGIGILTRQWQLMCMGIVYSWMTSAAMWQNFRARLPYLFDPWSEKVPPPPTVMHAMIAISVLIEVGAIFSGIFIAAAGRENMAVAQAIAYALIAAIVMYFTSTMMADRYLPPKEIWTWKEHCKEGRGRFVAALASGAAAGLVLAVFAHGYIMLIEQIGPIGEMIRSSNEFLDSVDGLRVAYFFCAVCVAPFAEEFLFRGMLFRALDKEWGGWKALLGSSVFFAIYHPPMAWLPVGILGLLNAFIFKKTGRLAPAVALHMVYNAVVLTW